MILLSNRRFCVVRISEIFGTGEATVHSWIERFEQEGINVPTSGINSKKSIFGALDIRTGKWLCRLFDHKRKERFIKFLNHIVSLYPTGRIHIILDNYSAHKAKLVQECLTNHPRVKLYYLPCYMPQLNPVEKIWWLRV